MRATVSMSDSSCASYCSELFVIAGLIEMVMGVDDEFDGQLGDDANFAEESLGGGLIFKGVDDGDAVIADHETRVGTGFAFGIVDGSVNSVA